MKLITKLIGGVWRYVALFGAAVLAWLANNIYQRNKGRKQNQQLQERIDNEQARNIRKRLDGVEPVRNDKLKYRDSEGDL